MSSETDYAIRNLRDPAATHPSIDTKRLAAELRRRVRGEVRFDDGARALYSTDASNYRQVPIGVVLPMDAEDIVETVGVCRMFGAPLLPRGGGTSLAGQCCNVAVVLDCSKHYNRILEIDPERRRARVQPGIVLDHLREAAETHELTFGPDPATHSRCTLGGMIGNDSCGVHSVMAGKTDANVEELEVLTYDGIRMRVGRTSEPDLDLIIGQAGRRGEIYTKLKSLRDRHADLIRKRFPAIPRRVSGYNLIHLLPENGFDLAKALVGSEGTCVTVLEATLRLVWSPPARVLVVAGFPDVYAAADHVPQVLGHVPIGLEGIDDRLVDDMRTIGHYPQGVALLPPGAGWLLVEFGAGDLDEARARARALMEELNREGGVCAKLFDDREGMKKIWKVRESGLGVTAHVPGRPLTWEGWEDAAVPPEQLGRYLRDFRKLLDKHGYDGVLYGHFGQGCLHTRNNFDLRSDDGLRRFRRFLYEAADLVVSYGGSLSGEHGDGQSRAELLPRMFGPEMIAVFREFKAAWDPDGGMNPGKLVDAYPIDENLRLRTGRAAPSLETRFHYPDDEGDLGRAVLRCVGVGECRRTEGGTMCPSYMVTREEMHSTRGRARLLFEMLQGDPIRRGWRDRHVRESLDLCLSCKGCKSDCPVKVDMATYKAEFLSHYYEGRLRPVAAYSMGLIAWWSRLASGAPSLANFITQTRGLRDIAKAAGGISPRRNLPPFADETFRRWFARQASPPPDGRRRVLLWPDTFTNHFHTRIGRAALEVLREAGFHVVVPRVSLCCGRPLYDHGMLGLARRWLARILRSLREEIRSGTPFVVLEPSCAAVFRDELRELFPADQDALRLREQTFLLCEFLERAAPGWHPPRLSRKALVHGHCHHKAVMGMSDELAVLAKMGLDFELLDSGCCGMAGSFGFEKSHYEIAMKAAERVLLPAVRKAAADTLIIADGFSCREQVEQGAGRRPLHLAEILQTALRGAPASTM